MRICYNCMVLCTGFLPYHDDLQTNFQDFKCIFVIFFGSLVVPSFGVFRRSCTPVKSSKHDMFNLDKYNNRARENMENKTKT